MYLTGKSPYPLERTLLTTGLTAAGVESLFRGQTRYETPHLAIRVPAHERIHFLENITMLTRRTFFRPPPYGRRARRSQPKRIAIVATVYRYLSHAQHMGDRFLVGYPYEGAWHSPNMKVVSLYVDQKPEGDLSESAREEFGFQVYPTIAETLRLRRQGTGGGCGANHRRARQLSAQ